MALADTTEQGARAQKNQEAQSVKESPAVSLDDCGHHFVDFLLLHGGSDVRLVCLSDGSKNL
jgi:hypothetical protein